MTSWTLILRHCGGGGSSLILSVLTHSSDEILISCFSHKATQVTKAGKKDMRQTSTIQLTDSAVCMQSESDDQPPVVDKLARFTVIWISRIGGRQCYLTSWPDAWSPLKPLFTPCCHAFSFTTLGNSESRVKRASYFFCGEFRGVMVEDIQAAVFQQLQLWYTFLPDSDLNGQPSQI